jgi:hypothetical protein
MNKLIVLNRITREVYVIPYDLRKYNDALECITDILRINAFDNIDFMEVDELNIKIL